jgi:hypothetical protein
MAVNNFLREHTGENFNGIQICACKEPIADPGAKKVFLFGKCAINTNKDFQGAIKVRGCPPGVQEIYETLKKELG